MKNQQSSPVWDLDTSHGDDLFLFPASWGQHAGTTDPGNKASPWRRFGIPTRWDVRSARAPGQAERNDRRAADPPGASHREQQHPDEPAAAAYRHCQQPAHTLLQGQG